MRKEHIMHKNKKYIPCEECDCEDCKTGKYRNGSWYCPLLKKQVCEVCCHYDIQGEEDCSKIKCKHKVSLI